MAQEKVNGFIWVPLILTQGPLFGAALAPLSYHRRPVYGELIIGLVGPDTPGHRAFQMRLLRTAGSVFWDPIGQRDLTRKTELTKISLDVRFAGVCFKQQGTRGFEESGGGHWRLIETSAVRLPSIGLEIGDGSSFRLMVRRTPTPCGVRSMIVVVTPEIEQLVFEIGGGPEEDAIQEFTSDRADESLDKGMG